MKPCRGHQMEVCGQLHTTAALSSRKGTGFHCTGGWGVRSSAAPGRRGHTKHKRDFLKFHYFCLGLTLWSLAPGAKILAASLGPKASLDAPEIRESLPLPVVPTTLSVWILWVKWFFFPTLGGMCCLQLRCLNYVQVACEITGRTKPTDYAERLHLSPLLFPWLWLAIIPCDILCSIRN
jgi:hypothetical protein